MFGLCNFKLTPEECRPQPTLRVKMSLENFCCTLALYERSIEREGYCICIDSPPSLLGKDYRKVKNLSSDFVNSQCIDLALQ